MRSTLRLLALLTLLAMPASAAHATRWMSWDAGLAKAGQSNRPVLVDVYTDWCGWCKRMDRDVYAQREISDYLDAHFVLIRLNAESNDTVHQGDRPLTARRLASSYNVTGYPTTIFLDAKGKHLANVPGYLPADRFLLLIRYIGDGHMDRGEKWDDYVSRGARKP